MDSKFTEYLEFRFVSLSASGKTERWHVLNRKNEYLLGSIAWSGPWRQYVFHPEDAVFNYGCLQDIVMFMKERLDARDVVSREPIRKHDHGCVCDGCRARYVSALRDELRETD